ncbi:MAG: MGMT family protein [Clostridia bacterium]
MNFYEKVYEIVRQIPMGKVATYGQIAMLAGSPRASRAVGFALHKNPDPSTIPCHRVVNRQGKLAEAFVFGGINEQRIRLENEAVTFADENHVDMEECLWRIGE